MLSCALVFLNCIIIKSCYSSSSCFFCNHVKIFSTSRDKWLLSVCGMNLCGFLLLLGTHLNVFGLCFCCCTLHEDLATCVYPVHVKLLGFVGFGMVGSWRDMAQDRSMWRDRIRVEG